ncbi:MAG: hypothetical protein H6843_14690 [Rhodospirillaceae bacterium]|nr:hypothetical protein [Rhodospirillaceae bacterium]
MLAWKRPRRVPLIASAVLYAGLAGAAAAQNGPASPFQVTCADFIAATEAPAGSDDNIRGNLMVYWAVGYFYGRFEDVPDANVTPERFAQNASDVVTALRQICPNVPEMPIADFARNLGNDLDASLPAQ